MGVNLLLALRVFRLLVDSVWQVPVRVKTLCFSTLLHSAAGTLLKAATSCEISLYVGSGNPWNLYT